MRDKAVVSFYARRNERQVADGHCHMAMPAASTWPRKRLVYPIYLALGCTPSHMCTLMVTVQLS